MLLRKHTIHHPKMNPLISCLDTKEYWSTVTFIYYIVNFWGEAFSLTRNSLICADDDLLYIYILHQTMHIPLLSLVLTTPTHKLTPCLEACR